MRLICLALILSFELLLIGVLLGREGLAGSLRTWGYWILRGVGGFAVLFVTFAWLKRKPALAAISAELAGSPISLRFLTAHLVSFTIFALLTSTLNGRASSDLLAVVWPATGLGAIAFAGLAFIPQAFWLRIARDTGFLWVWTGAAVLLASFAGAATQSLWPLATSITFRLSQAVLSPFVTGMVVDPANRLIGTQRFLIELAPKCSGLEGVGLILAFGITWLALFRRECRFPQALILLPVGVAIVFALNAVRIAALVLIGDAGAPHIAQHGFHSQVGWIIFNLVAVGFSVAARKVPWLTVAEPGTPAATSFENPTTRWVLPFVMILAAGTISASMTGDFEWLYPLRFLAAAITLTLLWPLLWGRYADLDWRVGWLAPAVGAIVFLVWIGLDRFTSAVPEAMPAPLAAAPPLARTVWLAFRVLAAVVTVPVAEELAFRGFLYRRLLSPDFESVDLRRFSWLALLVSSLLFGLLHGDRWFVGILAGALYALVLLRRGSIGDAVAAHATTNALLAVDVLAFHHWHLW